MDLLELLLQNILGLERNLDVEHKQCPEISVHLDCLVRLRGLALEEVLQSLNSILEDSRVIYLIKKQAGDSYSNFN